MQKFKNIVTSKKGFTLIELLVVIGILAVLAAIAIPSVAGLIDRANVSADKSNANEMTNALERFTSEFELFVQDVSSGTVDTDDAATGRVLKAAGLTAPVTRTMISDIEDKDNAAYKINIDSKYPANEATMKNLVRAYMKTTSSTFEPKQSDCHFYYSPECGIVVCSNKNTEAELIKLVNSGTTAKGETLTAANSTWIDLTTDADGDLAS